MSKKTGSRKGSGAKNSRAKGSATTATKHKKPISDFDAALKALEAFPNSRRLPDGFAIILPHPNNRSR